jgi:alpha-acetolactate decarboxylase
MTPATMHVVDGELVMIRKNKVMGENEKVMGDVSCDMMVPYVLTRHGVIFQNMT